MTVILRIDGRDFSADFVKSEDAGYSPGKLLLDMPNGDHISVYKHGRKWIEAYVRDRICRRSVTHKTRREALASAAMELVSATMDAEAFVP